MRNHIYQFSDKIDNFEFLGPNLPKNRFRGRNFKSLSLDSESASMRSYVHQFLDKTDKSEFFWPKFAQKWILSLEFQKSKSGFGISILWGYFVYQFSDKINNFEFLSPSLPKKGFWCQNLKNLRLDLELTPPKYYVCQFLVKMDNF